MVVVDAVMRIVSVVVVVSDAQQDQPFGAVSPVAPSMVTVTVQVPVVPLAKLPAVAPPTVVPAEHPDIVNLVPLEVYPAELVMSCGLPSCTHELHDAVAPEPITVM